MEHINRPKNQEIAATLFPSRSKKGLDNGLDENRHRNEDLRLSWLPD